MKEEPQKPSVATSAEFTIPIEDLVGMLGGLDEEPVRPRVLTVQDELMRFVAEAADSSQPASAEVVRTRPTSAGERTIRAHL